jgi:hypothetical protein
MSRFFCRVYCISTRTDEITLLQHCIYRCDFTSYPTLITLLAKRTYISEYDCWYVSLQCYETYVYTDVQSSTYRSAATKCTDKVIRHKQFEITYSTTVC